MLQDSYIWGNLYWFALKVDFFKGPQEIALYDNSGSMLLISKGIEAHKTFKRCFRNVKLSKRSFPGYFCTTAQLYSIRQTFEKTAEEKKSYYKQTHKTPNAFFLPLHS